MQNKNNPNSPNPLKQLEEVTELESLTQALGLVEQAPFQIYRAFAQKSRNPLTREWAIQRWRGFLTEPLLNALLEEQTAKWRSVQEGRAVPIAIQAGTRRVAVVDVLSFRKGMLLIRPPGSDTGEYVGWIVRNIKERGVFVEIEAKRPDCSRLLRSFPDAFYLRHDNMPINLLEPNQHPRAYAALFVRELARWGNLRPETQIELISRLERMYAGVPQGASYPSLTDFERTLFAMATRESSTKLATAARTLLSLNAHLGRTANVRKAPDLSQRFNVVIYDFSDTPPKLYAFLSAIRLLKS